MEGLLVCKIGANIIEDEQLLNDFCQWFSSKKTKKILVHGGGKIATNYMQRLGLEPVYVDGRRVTDKETMEVCLMTYAGLINKKIVSSLQALELDAIGLSGADGNLIQAEMRPKTPIDFGYVGDIHAAGINSLLLKNILNIDLTPVICSITHDKQGVLLNTNADTIANCVALSLSEFYKVRLFLFIDKAGVLYNPSDDSSVLEEINAEKYQELVHQQVITGGMLPKLETSFEALKGGISEVVICNLQQLLGSNIYTKLCL